jgi:hypothetical protein
MKAENDAEEKGEANADGDRDHNHTRLVHQAAYLVITALNRKYQITINLFQEISKFLSYTTLKLLLLTVGAYGQSG